MSEEVITTLHAASIMYVPTLNYLSLGPRPLSKANVYLVVQRIYCFIEY